MWQTAQRKKETQEQERELLLINRRCELGLKHKQESVEQIRMPQETEEIKLKATDLLVKHSAHLLQIENQRTESTILHQLVE
jgi:hypothetical protein